MLAALWLLLSITIKCSTQANTNHRRMLFAVHTYRGSAMRGNLFTAISSLMQVQPESNPILLEAFYNTCSHYDSVLSKTISVYLFPNFILPLMVPTTIPKDIARLFPQTPNGVVSLTSFIQSAPREKQYFLRMALFEWNHLILGMQEASPELLKRINTTVDPLVYESFVSRLQMAIIVKDYFVKEGQFSAKDAWILFKLLEYLRHLMALQWPTVIELKVFDTLEQLWKAFVVNIHKNYPNSQSAE